MRFMERCLTFCFRRLQRSQAAAMRVSPRRCRRAMKGELLAVLVSDMLPSRGNVEPDGRVKAFLGVRAGGRL